MCDATITDYNSVLYHASMQRIAVYGSKPCSRKSIETLGSLQLCKVHARMAREGLVDENGRVARKADIDNVRRYPKNFPGGLYDWVRKLANDDPT